MSDVTDVETAEIDQIMSVQTSDEVKEEPVDPVRAIIAEVEPDDSDKEYKQSDFYKQTKIDLLNLVELYKKMNPINFNKLKDEIQNLIDNLSLDRIEELMNQFMGEGEQLTQLFEEKIEGFKELVK